MTVFIVFKTRRLDNGDWREDIAGVYKSREQAEEEVQKSGNGYFREYQVN